MARQPTPQLAQAINLLHQALALEPEPEDKAVIATCLQNLTRLQAKNAQQAGGAAAAMGGGNYGGGSPPAGPATPADPRAALMSLMGR